MQVKRRLEDFATKKKSYGQSGKNSTIAWEITNVEILKNYLQEHNNRPGDLAKSLQVPYSRIKRLLVLAGLWDQAVIKKQKGKTGRKKTTTHDKWGYEYASDEHDYYDKYGNKCRRYTHHVEAEKKLGRKLEPFETVHHVNLDKIDNSQENLHVCDNSTHRRIHQNLEHLAGRLMESGYIAFVPDLEEYIFVGPQPKLKLSTTDSIGLVEVVDVLGQDTTVVNAARVSFGKSIGSIREQDKKLLKYLAEHGHTSPFRHVIVQFHVKAPEFVARQWYKHIIGSDYAFKDCAWNEISGRYVEYDLESYNPVGFRRQSLDNKQGSSDVVIEDQNLMDQFKDQIDNCFRLYSLLLERGVAKEQARMILPLTFYTEWYWTASLQAIHHFVTLRSESHAQVEIREYADLVDQAMRSLFPNAWEALKKASPRS